MPTRPEGLTAGARAHWDRLAPVLHRLGLLTRADVTALRHLCELLALSDDVLVRIKSKSPDYGRNVRLWLALQAALWTRLEGFGMTPASRARMHVEVPKPEPDELEKPPLRLCADESALNL
jgi:phage terminase small subunit